MYRAVSISTYMITRTSLFSSLMKDTPILPKNHIQKSVHLSRELVRNIQPYGRKYKNNWKRVTGRIFVMKRVTDCNEASTSFQQTSHFHPSNSTLWFRTTTGTRPVGIEQGSQYHLLSWCPLVVHFQMPWSRNYEGVEQGRWSKVLSFMSSPCICLDEGQLLILLEMFWCSLRNPCLSEENALLIARFLDSGHSSSRFTVRRKCLSDSTFAASLLFKYPK